MPKAEGGGRIDVLDGLRGFAILQVLLLHVWELSWIDLNFKLFGHDIRFAPIPVTGFMGVELFFFISGFCLFYPHARHMFEGRALPTLRQYASKRAIKILPSYYLSMLLILVFFRPAYASLGEGAWDVISHLLFIHDWFPRNAGSINGVFWSLGVEVQFYLVFPLLAWLFRKRPAIVWAAICALAAAYRFWARSRGGDFERLVTVLPGFVDLFACGMMASTLVVFARTKADAAGKLKPEFSILAVLAAVAFLLMLGRLYDIRYLPQPTPTWNVPWRAANRLWLGMIFIVLAVSASLSWKWLQRLLANPVLVFLSTISYNLYIWHQFIARMMKERWRFPPAATLDPHDDPRWKLVFSIMAIIISVSFAAALTYGFERPLLERGVAGSLRAIARPFARKKSEAA